MPLAQLKAAGEADLQRNLDALKAACDQFAAGKPLSDCMETANADKPVEQLHKCVATVLLRRTGHCKLIGVLPGRGDALGGLGVRLEKIRHPLIAPIARQRFGLPEPGEKLRHFVRIESSAGRQLLTEPIGLALLIAAVSCQKDRAHTHRRRRAENPSASRFPLSSIRLCSAPNYPVLIVGINKSTEVVTLKNVSPDPINLDDWHMCSIKGNQEHSVGGPLAPGEQRDFGGPMGPIWSNSEQDDGALYNPQGQLVSYWHDR